MALCRFLTIWMVFISSAWAGSSAPQVVLHPLTQEERLQEGDYMSLPPLMEAASPFKPFSGQAVLDRAKELGSGAAATESPFVDWARAAILALSDLDPQSPSELEQGLAIGSLWESLRPAAMERFQKLEPLRVLTYEDSALCSWRETQASRAQCQAGARWKAKQADPALGSSFAAFALGASAAMDSAAPFGTELAWFAPRGKSAAEVELFIARRSRLGAWALRLNPAPLAQEAPSIGARLSLWIFESGWKASSSEPRLGLDFLNR